MNGRAAISPARKIALALIGLALVAGALAYVLANRPDESERPYLAIVGGGFIFNYRLAEVFYGFTAKVVRPIPIGTVIEAEFEDPAGGAPIVVRQQAGRNQTEYTLRTPPLNGVEENRPYRVVIRLRERGSDGVFWTTERTYASELPQAALPEGPLTVGPGYHRPQQK